MDSLSPVSDPSTCDNCQNNKAVPCASSSCCCTSEKVSRKRKYTGTGRDPDELKRRSVISRLHNDLSDQFSSRSIPSPLSPSSSPVLSAKSLYDHSQLNMDISAMSEEHAVLVGSTTELESSLFSILDMSHLTGQSTSFIQRGSALFSLDHDLAARSQSSRLHATRKILSSVGFFASNLIDVYEQHVHLNFPTVDPEFLVNARQGNVAQLEPTLLAAIYAVAMPWLETRDPPSASNLDDIAFGLFTKMLRVPSLHIVQAGLLLMQRPDVDSKILNSQLIGAAYEVGLHLDCSSWDNITEDEKNLRRRLAWALYMQDTWCSLIHGRPAWIDRNNWAVQDLDGSEFQITPDIEMGTSNDHLLFLQLVNLTKILSSILDTFYTLKAMREIKECGSGGTRVILERAKPVQLRLKNWFAGLAPVLKLDAAESNQTPAIGLLHLAYFATEITLHRCIVRSLETCSTDAYLTHICRSAAKTRLISAMDFVNRLRPEHLKAFWYFPASVSFALIASFGSLLLATASCLEEQEFYQTRLNEYRWTVSVSSRATPFLALALETLDHGERLMKNLPSKPPSAEITVPVMPQPLQGATSDFGKRMHEDYSESEDSGDDTLDDNDGQTHQIASGLMSPSTSTEDYLDTNMVHGMIQLD